MTLLAAVITSGQMATRQYDRVLQIVKTNATRLCLLLHQRLARNFDVGVEQLPECDDTFHELFLHPSNRFIRNIVKIEQFVHVFDRHVLDIFFEMNVVHCHNRTMGTVAISSNTFFGVNIQSMEMRTNVIVSSMV